MPPNDEPRAGFTLLEMLLASVLFATGTIAIMSLIQQAHAGMAEGENVLITTHLAKRRLEELRNTAYGSLASESKASVTSPSGFTRFSRAVTVTDEPLSLSSLKQIVVTVYWDTQGGEASTSLQTYVSQH